MNTQNEVNGKENYRREIIRMANEINDGFMLCKIYHYILVKYRKIKEAEM